MFASSEFSGSFTKARNTDLPPATSVCSNISNTRDGSSEKNDWAKSRATRCQRQKDRAGGNHTDWCPGHLKTRLILSRLGKCPAIFQFAHARVPGSGSLGRVCVPEWLD